MIGGNSVDDNWIVTEYYRSMVLDDSVDSSVDLFSELMRSWVNNMIPWFGANVGLRMMCWNCRFIGKRTGGGFLCMNKSTEQFNMELCDDWKFNSYAWSLDWWAFRE